MGVGMLAGSEGYGIQFENFDYANAIGTVALCVILFSGGLDTRFGDIKPVLKQGVLLSTLGVLFTTILTGAAIYALFYFCISNIYLSIWEAMLLAAIMSSTDSAAVFSILRGKNLSSLKYNLRPMLELESGSNDPMAYMLVIVLVGVITGETQGGWMITWMFVQQLAFGAMGGLLFGKLFVRILNKINLQYEALYPICLLAFSFFTFSFINVINGNGYLAVYLCGLMLGNARFPHKRTTMSFFDGISWLMQIVMFLCLGLLVTPSELLPCILIGLAISGVMILLSRPISVFLCFLFLRKKERLRRRGFLFVSFVGLKGAVPIIFAIYPLVENVPHAKTMFNIVFIVTIVSLLIQGTFLPFLAKKLHLILPEGLAGKLKNFDFAFSDDVKSVMGEVVVTEEMLQKGNKIMHLDLPHNALIVMIKRDTKYILPRGTITLQPRDILLLITDNEKALADVFAHLGIGAAE
ncbi:K+/H+ antiporter [Bacteroidia bacterium]|nr:K+/H+ antiporter [Bacteroidia bacterium]